MTAHRLALALAGTTILAACATQPPAVTPAFQASTVQPEPKRPYTMQDLVVPRSATGPVPDGGAENVTLKDVQQQVGSANAQSLVLPKLSCFAGATCRHW